MRAPIWIKPGSSKLLVGGHRGASAVAPENTADAFEAAIAAGADFIETDLRLTHDGVPVAFHDGDLRRLAGDPRQVSELDMDELRNLHPGIVAMVDAIDLVGERASILLDTKLYDPMALEHCITVLSSRLEGGRIAFGVRSLDVFDVVHQRLPHCPTLGLFSDIGDYPELAARGGNWARLWEKDASEDNIETLRRHGLKSIIMTGQPNDGSVGLIEPAALAKLVTVSPDAVMLNDPSLALEVIARRQPM